MGSLLEAVEADEGPHERLSEQTFRVRGVVRHLQGRGMQRVEMGHRLPGEPVA